MAPAFPVPGDPVLYDPDVPGRPAGDRRSRLLSRSPAVGGVREVLRAHLVDHAYPLHAHDTWTVLLIDDGVVRYDLDRRTHDAPTPLVTLLPPHVPHNGAPTTPNGLRKRVLYLEESLLGRDLVGPAVDRPGLPDPLLRSRLHRLHLALARPGEELEAETRLAFVVERLRTRWLRPSADGSAPGPRTPVGPADRLRELLHARVREGVTLAEAADLLGVHPTHLVRAFTRRVGMPPHAYLVTLRVDLARRLLLEGCPPAEAAVLAGFHDQPHLTRHFRRVLGVPPGRWLRGTG
ncbi:helix-turn-helix domain-containing protein [Streptomyces calidiresistens]|uniref:Helix-turn-helix domain-containing protein n=1 Tax=Streptomyces calidiresistens TaxID=1485586 RepID=A0A7W3XWM2_9ACTN|nr:helix-turn-helix domain-containing protein [Streptomyces calidiresistens]